MKRAASLLVRNTQARRQDRTLKTPRFYFYFRGILMCKHPWHKEYLVPDTPLGFFLS